MKIFLRGWLLLVVLWGGCQQSETDVYVPLLSEESRQRLQVLPLPYRADVREQRNALSGGVDIQIKGATDVVATQAFERFVSWLGQPEADVQRWQLIISLKEATTYPLTEDTEESYSLEVTDHKIMITANNGIGALRAFATLKQLIITDGDKKYLPNCSIVDQPRYPWRGLMIDVSRHFIDIKTLKENIDNMSSAKMNVLHLHLSDNQAFRVESEVLPKLYKNSPDGRYYTQAELKDLVDYAALRGVRIVPEFNLPGHATPWLVAYPEMGLKDNYTMRTNYGVFPETLDPTNQEMYVELAKFIKEITTIFPDEYLHIGGDEVLLTEWEKESHLQKFIEEKSLRNVDDLRTYFCLRMADILRRADRKMIIWDDAMRPELSKAMVMTQAARSGNAVYESIGMDAAAIRSAGWSLDHRLPIEELYRVDPTDQPDYMNLNVDSTEWVAYELSTGANNETANGAMFLFGEGERLNGMITLNNRNNIFKKVRKERDRLQFTYDSAGGPVVGELILKDGKVAGVMALSVAQMRISGTKIGGNDMPEGIILPDFTAPPAPTTAQMELIKGGEACAWSEWADDQTIIQMIWPQAYAIAEKLWSPKEYTDDVDDLYRRIEKIDQENPTHLKIAERQLKHTTSLGSNNGQAAQLYELIQYLEPVKYYGRWAHTADHDIKSPLNKTVDLLPAESMASRDFARDVEQYLTNRTEANERVVLNKLKRWSDWYDTLYADAKTSKKLTDVAPHLSAMTKLARLALATQQGVKLTEEGRANAQKIINQEVKPHGAMELAVAPVLLELINYQPSPLK